MTRKNTMSPCSRMGREKRKISTCDNKVPGPAAYTIKSTERVSAGDIGKRSRKFDVRHMVRASDFHRY